MAGSYMDAPRARMSYDRDGSIATVITVAGKQTLLNTNQLRAMNSEEEVGAFNLQGNRLAIIFPVPVDIAALFAPNFAGWTLETSKDTTNGADGSWDSHGLIVAPTQPGVRPAYRQRANLSLTQPGLLSTGVRGVRVRNPAADTGIAPAALHVYADVETADIAALAFWQPDTNAAVPPAYFDWGNVARASSADRSFRLKNLSSDLTATGISIYADALTPGSPSVAGEHTFSVDGGATFRSNVTVASLSPGQISNPIIVRRSLPINAQVSTWSARLAADVTTWS